MKMSSIFGMILGILLMPVCMQAENNGSYSFPIEQSPDPSLPKKDVNRHRIPPRPLLCTINLDEGSVSFENESLAGTFTLYEVWDEDTSSLLFSTASVSTFINHLKSLDDTACQIRFLSYDSCFIGYIQL